MKSRVKAFIVPIAALLTFLFALTACGGLAPATKYTVTFNLNGGELVSGQLEQSVEEGAAAVAPSAEKNGMLLSWDKDFSSVTYDMTVNAEWEKRELTSTEVAAHVQKSTVTINCDFYNGSVGSGSGFFIDDQGTIVTCYHVIEYANSISVEIYEGGTYPVDTIVAFNELYDLAILKIKMPGSPGLTVSNDPVNIGEMVYANGSALGTLQGTFTSGTVSSTSRTVNGITCIQMDAAISSGNSGGPLVNRFGEVIGVNALSYVGGENLNMAIKIENMDKLSNEVNYSVKSYEEWIMKETDRSYSPYDEYGDFYFSTINTYSYVTGRACDASVDFDGSVYSGYLDMCEYYVYYYTEADEDAYVTYLKSKGFEFSERESFNDGVSYYYLNEWSGTMVDMYHGNDGLLYIWVTRY